MEVMIKHSLTDISRDEWRALEIPNFPFWDYDFIMALEKSGSIGERTGWFPAFFIARDGSDIAGALPVYIKTNSYGEYIFDWQWADAYHHNGIAYYPKLTTAVPFTPATGPRILINPNKDMNAVRHALLTKALEFYQQQPFSSFHALFLPKTEASAWEDHGFSKRVTYQYHWINRDYTQFDDFVNSLKGKRRRQINRERAVVRDQEITIRSFSGNTLQSGHAAVFYQFYLSTLDKKQGIPYLSEDFFHRIFSTMQDRVLLIMAFNKENQTVAGSLSFYKGDTLYGRYWGASETYRNLHFELCYYQLIDFAISKNIQLFEAGAQGWHKVQRGFAATETFSMHLIKEKNFAKAIGDYIKEETKQTLHEISDQNQSLPFKTVTKPL